MTRPPKDRSQRAAPFRARYAELEERRMALHARLAAVSDKVKEHPGYKNARKLLNEKFRVASVAQRAAILDSATWLIQVLDTLSKLD